MYPSRYSAHSLCGMFDDAAGAVDPKVNNTTTSNTICNESQPAPTQKRVVIFQDNNICILHPQCPHGILIRTRIPLDMIDTVRRDGLKSGARLRSEGVEVRMFNWNCVFFQAPCSYVEPMHSDYSHTNDRAQVEEAYGGGSCDRPDYVYIRVDPEFTSVFSSEINAAFRSDLIPGRPTTLKHQSFYNSAAMEWLMRIRDCSRKSLAQYLTIIRNNAMFMEDRVGIPQPKFQWNLYSSKVEEASDMQRILYPCDPHDVSQNSEVIINLEVIPPEWWVSIAEPVLALRGRCTECQKLKIDWCWHGEETWVAEAEAVKIVLEKTPSSPNPHPNSKKKKKKKKK